MFFERGYIKEGKHYRHALRRLIHYKEDILKPDELARLRELEAELREALRSSKREAIGVVQQKIETEVKEISPPPPDASWRENVEVFLVAIIIAAGVRAYFLQPFKIPTGSMQPTLFGVVGTPSDEAAPNIIRRAVEFVWIGRSYVNVTAKEDDVVEGLAEKTYLNFFTFTDIVCRKHTYRTFAPADVVYRDFRVDRGRIIRAGEKIVSGHVDTGDQVFVDKASYNFMNPSRGDVFVFKTTGITRISMPPGVESQHYIKRLAGVPGDTLRISSPDLYIDGKIASLPVFRRVMKAENGYEGYSNMPGSLYLSTPDDTVVLPKKSYFALGDNSYHSSDSRYWGVVPEQKVAGRGLFVYWPFTKRWGLIR